MPLTIYNKKINKISGPVSMRILTPNKTKFNNYKKIGMKLPIYILFGDNHLSSKNMCEICECKDGSSSCCYKIYDPNFMRLIDKVVSPGYSVDFYVEDWGHQETENVDLTKYNGTTSLSPLHLVTTPYGVCYNRKLRETKQYRKGCPTKGLRWHSADVRKLYDINKYTFELFCNFIILEHPVEEERKYLSGIKKRSARIEYIKKVFDLMISIFSKQQIKKYSDVINNLITNKKPAMGLLSPHESLIVKQISKFPIEAQDDWIKRVDKYIHTTINKSSPKKEELQKILEIINEYVSATENNSNTTLILSDLELAYKKGKFYDINIDNDLLDCYFICRSIKPVKGDPSVLTISYFGDQHCCNISKFLVDDFEYDMVFEHAADVDYDDPDISYIDLALQLENIQRCIKITPNINIDQMLKKYGYNIPNTGHPDILPFDTPQVSYDMYDKKSLPRCKNDSHRKKITGNCEPYIKKSSKHSLKKSLSRCPNGSRRNKITGNCEPYKK